MKDVHDHPLERDVSHQTGAWWAERRRNGTLERERRERREDRLHRLGVVLLWLSTIVFAFGIRAAALTWVWIVMALFFGGLFMMSAYRRRR